jgi:hypothetical protein
MRVLFGHATTVFVLLVGNPLGAQEAAPASPPGSLQPAFDAAGKLAADPATQAAAIEKLEALVDLHRANSKLYDRAVALLFRHYIQTDQGEQVARLASQAIAYETGRFEQPVLSRLLEEARRKFPDQFAELDAQRGGAARPAPPSQDVDDDLAEGILQRGDRELREKSLAALRQQLTAKAGPGQQIAGLVNLGRALSAKFDREPFRQLVLPLLESDDETVRSLAVSCLPGLSENRDDLARLLPLTADPSPAVRSQLAGALIGLGQGQAVDQVAPALVRLLRDDNEDVIHDSIRSMWGQYRTPDLNEVLIELSNHPRHHHVAIYHGLSTQQEKSVEVCRRLVEELADPDWNNSGRAAWGLTYGVVPEAAALVEQGLLAALPEETNAYTRGQEFRALATVATEASRAYLEQVVRSTAETDEVRAQAQQILDQLDAPR